MSTYENMPEDLPRPIDDGACDHLIGMKLPDIDLLATDGSVVNLSEQKRKTVIYCYPMTGKPGVPLPEGWDEIPGARGCIPSYHDERNYIDGMLKTAGRGQEFVCQPNQNDKFEEWMLDLFSLSLIHI